MKGAVGDFAHGEAVDAVLQPQNFMPAGGSVFQDNLVSVKIPNILLVVAHTAALLLLTHLQLVLNMLRVTLPFVVQRVKEVHGRVRLGLGGHQQRGGDHAAGQRLVSLGGRQTREQFAVVMMGWFLPVRVQLDLL